MLRIQSGDTMNPVYSNQVLLENHKNHPRWRTTQTGVDSVGDGSVDIPVPRRTSMRCLLNEGRAVNRALKEVAGRLIAQSAGKLEFRVT